MSRLTDKYQSYLHFLGISFDQSTFTADPAETGSKSFQGVTPATFDGFTQDGNQPPTIQTGVIPDQKYYELEFDSTSTPNKNSRLLYGSTVSSVAGQFGDVRRTMWDSTPFDRVTGIWVKTPSQFGLNNALIGGMRWTFGTQAIITIGLGKSNDLPAISIVHSTAELPTASTNFYTSYTDQNSNVVPIEWDKWYFVAVKKSVVETGGGGSPGSAMTGTLQYQHYINGELVNTVTTSNWTKRNVSAIIFGNNAAFTGTGAYKIGISSWFVADWSDVTQTGLRDIYNYGAPIQAPVKHYNGTAWVDDIAPPKAYYNGAWRDIYANRWTGSAWVPL